MIASSSKSSLRICRSVLVVVVKEVIAMSNRRSTLRREPGLAVWSLLVLLGRDEALDSHSYPIGQLLRNARRTSIEYAVKRNVSKERPETIPVSLGVSKDAAMERDIRRSFAFGKYLNCDN